MTKAALVVNGVVENTALYEGDTPPDDYVDCSQGTGIGFIDNGDGTFSAPVPEDIPATPEEQAQLDKFAGIEFGGVMCSATAEDMWGLSAIKSWVLAGNDTGFKFSNGNVLTLTAANVADFEAVWTPFRASFF